jgi:dihydroflavonol-4-reductase
MFTAKKVLLTGVTGFLGSHIAIQLLNKGYEVIGTLRDMSRAEEIAKIISAHTQNIDCLQIVQADLLDEKIWLSLTKDIDYVLHVASPFPRTLPKREEDVLLPAKNGTLNVLKASAVNGVKRFVLTSSSGAVTYGVDKSKRKSTFNENDWTDPTNKEDTSPYYRSKTYAELAAWDFIKNTKTDMEFVVICPGANLGPVLETDFGTTPNMIISILDGSAPALFGFGYDIVDVRSTADLHIRAMETKEAAGQRFVASAGYLTFKEMGDILREKYPDRKIPKAVMPNFMVRVLSNFIPVIKPLLVELNSERKMDSSKAKKLLGWEPISPKEAVLACAESLIKLKLV